MKLNLFSRTLCLVALVCMYTTAVDSTEEGGDSLEDFPSSFTDLPDKREPYKKLRSHNPILIFHQSIRHPRYLPRISSLTEEPVGGYDIPRRLIRRGNNRTHSNVAPLLVWNHQLLPNFYNKRQPPFFMSLRKEGYTGNIKSNQAVKRSGLGWLLLPKPYDETNAQGLPYDELQSQENEDDYHVESDLNGPDYDAASDKMKPFH